MRAALLVTAALLAGCVGPMRDTFEDRSAEYQQSYTFEAIELPEEFGVRQPREAFSIPGVDAPVAGVGGGSFEIPAAPVSDPRLRSSDSQILTGTRQVYLRLDATPETVWPELDAFFRENGIPVLADRDRARIQTGWLAGESSGVTDGVLRRYLPDPNDGWRRLTLDVAPGLAAGSTEIRGQLVTRAGPNRPAPSAEGDGADPQTLSLWLDEFSVWLSDAKQQGRRVSAVGLGQGALPRVSREVLDDGRLAVLIRVVPEDPFASLTAATQAAGGEIEFEDARGGRLQARYVVDSDRRALDEMNLLTRVLAIATGNLDGLYQLSIETVPEGLRITVLDLAQGGSYVGGEELLLKIAEQFI